MADRIGDWFLTYSGVEFYPLDPRPEDVRSVDIAHALSRICRYGGHTRDWYSVAQHSLMVSSLVSAPLALHGLLHDAEEAYTGDLIRPLKIGLRGRTTAWDEIADRLTAAIEQAFGLRKLSDGEYAEIKAADNTALSTERRDLIDAAGREWRVSRSHPAALEPIVVLEREHAEYLFLNRLARLLTSGVGR